MEPCPSCVDKVCGIFRASWEVAKKKETAFTVITVVAEAAVGGAVAAMVH